MPRGYCIERLSDGDVQVVVKVVSPLWAIAIQLLVPFIFIIVGFYVLATNHSGVALVIGIVFPCAGLSVLLIGVRMLRAYRRGCMATYTINDSTWTVHMLSLVPWNGLVLHSTYLLSRMGPFEGLTQTTTTTTTDSNGHQSTSSATVHYATFSYDGAQVKSFGSACYSEVVSFVADVLPFLPPHMRV
ncbi:Aste57867_22765 [Aphanomyces stellatus]|uniref:Aste57867_22765 protein n=1 Tax=Aphanomyces stellatus TaxID=120398 RepID=A0A485LKV8_9STRA|nr:hypothetical protein As57867_022695 [Aphanomyces stellatus]VFT99418.1 Aste57867_22765 [Aphanomyces stellatus]